MASLNRFICCERYLQRVYGKRKISKMCQCHFYHYASIHHSIQHVWCFSNRLFVSYIARHLLYYVTSEGLTKPSNLVAMKILPVHASEQLDRDRLLQYSGCIHLGELPLGELLGWLAVVHEQKPLNHFGKVPDQVVLKTGHCLEPAQTCNLAYHYSMFDSRTEDRDLMLQIDVICRSTLHWIQQYRIDMSA